MNTLLEQISKCIELGKINKESPYPPDMKGQNGADELTKKALDEGIGPNEILENGLIPAMGIVGNKFSKNEIFVPQMLMSAKAMSGAMQHLRPYFQSGEAKRKGVFVIGTVAGDLHDIGKNLVAMMIEGGGWEVIDLGVDVPTAKFEESIEQYSGCIIGLSALLTTTMTNMGNTVRELKAKYADTQILIGGAPVTQEYCKEIGANFYAPDPQLAVEYLNTLAS